MNVLITGGNGFLGKYIVNNLSSICNSVDTLGLSNSNTICLDLKEKILLKINQYDLVVHAAGKAHILPESDFEVQEFFNLNVIGTMNLLDGLVMWGLPKYFVFISSVSVYGINSGIEIKENYPLSASEPYGLSKIIAERLVIDWCQKHNIVCTILRLPLIVGENPPGNLGAMINAIQKSYYFNIAGGNAKKSMVLADDVARSIIDVAEIGGIYNLTDGYHPSFKDLSNHISIQLGKGKPMNISLSFANIVAKFGDLLGSIAPLNTKKLKKITSDLTFDDSKAKNAFGWSPTPVLEGLS